MLLHYIQHFASIRLKEDKYQNSSATASNDTNQDLQLYP